MVLFWLCSLRVRYVIQTQKVSKYHGCDSTVTLNGVLIICEEAKELVCVCVGAMQETVLQGQAVLHFMSHRHLDIVHSSGVLKKYSRHTPGATLYL